MALAKGQNIRRSPQTIVSRVVSTCVNKYGNSIVGMEKYKLEKTNN